MLPRRSAHLAPPLCSCPSPPRSPRAPPRVAPHGRRRRRPRRRRHWWRLAWRCRCRRGVRARRPRWSSARRTRRGWRSCAPSWAIPWDAARRDLDSLHSHGTPHTQVHAAERSGNVPVGLSAYLSGGLHPKLLVRATEGAAHRPSSAQHGCASIPSWSAAVGLTVAMVAPVVRYPLIRARWRSQSKVTQRRGTLIAVAVFIAVYMVRLYLSSGTARTTAGAGRAVTAPLTEHIIYTSDEGAPLC